jgi:peptide deformylase
MASLALLSAARTASRASVASAFAPGVICYSPIPQSTVVQPQARPFSSKSSESASLMSSIRSQITTLFSTTEEVDPGVIEGTDLVVLKYPHPSLRAPNAEIPVEELTGPGSEISRIAKEMFLVMYATEGVGLAAPQVGINKRLMVYNESGDKKKWMQEVVMVNPKIVEFSEGKDVENEGCLSFPGMRGDVERSKWIKVEALNLKGKKIKKKFTGWEARIFQHEYDHLDGVVYVDRLTEAGRKEVQPALDELVEKFGEGGAL